MKKSGMDYFHFFPAANTSPVITRPAIATRGERGCLVGLGVGRVVGGVVGMVVGGAADTEIYPGRFREPVPSAFVASSTIV